MKKDTITIDQFIQLDIRVGQIKKAESLPESKKLLRLLVDLGPDYGIVTVLAGIAEFYAPDDIVDKKMLFLANLEPRAMMGEESQGMMLAVDNEGRPLVTELVNDMPVGATVR